MGKVFVLKSSHGGRQGGRWGPKIPFLAPKRAILGNRGQKTAQRAPTRGARWANGKGGIEAHLSEAKKMSYVGVA